LAHKSDLLYSPRYGRLEEDISGCIVIVINIYPNPGIISLTSK